MEYNRDMKYVTEKIDGLLMDGLLITYTICFGIILAYNSTKPGRVWIFEGGTGERDYNK